MCIRGRLLKRKDAIEGGHVSDITVQDSRIVAIVAVEVVNSDDSPGCAAYCEMRVASCELHAFGVVRFEVMVDFAVALYGDGCFATAAPAYETRELLIWILMFHSSDAVLVEEVLEIVRTEVSVTVADVATCKTHNAVCEFELTVADCGAIGILTLCVADDSTRTTVVAILDSYGPVVHGEGLTIIGEIEGVVVVKAVDSSVLDSDHSS